MPKPTYNPKNDRRRFDEIMSREPGSRLSDDDLFVFENEINRRREQAARNELYDQYKRETAAANAVPGSLDAPTIERARTRNIQAGPQLVPKSRNERSRYGDEGKKPQSRNERSQAARGIQTGGGRPRFDRVISGGAGMSAAQMTNLGGTALEGLKHLNDIAYRHENESQIKAAQNSLKYWTGVLEKAASDAERHRAEEMINRAKRALNVHEDTMEDQTAAVMGAARKVYGRADELQERAQQDIDKAKEGLGTVGRLLVDAGVAGTQMVGDAVANTIVPGSGLAAMGARVFGGGTQQVRQAGGSYGEQLSYGGASAAVEVATEKMFGVFENIYGKGWLDNTGLVKGAKEAVKKLNLTPAGRTALALLGNAGEEATEEVVSGILSPLIDSIYNDKTAAQNYREMDLSEVMHDALVGGVLGLLGGNSQVMANAAETKAYGDVYGADSAALVQEALDIDPENRTAQEARKRLEQGKTVPARMIRQMVEENEGQVEFQRQTEVRKNGTVDEEEAVEEDAAAEEKVEDDLNKRLTERLRYNLMKRATPEAALLREKAGEFGEAAQDFLESWQAGQDPETYYSGFQAAYLYGKANSGTTGQIDTETREELRQATGLTDGQIDLAYSLGRAEVNRQERTDPRGAASLGMTEDVDPRGAASLGMTEEGAEQYGAEQAEGVRVRDGGQRLDGTDPRGPAETVAEGTGGAEVRQTQGRAADRGAAAFTYAREGRSTAQLIGGSRGSSTDSLRIVTGGKSASVQQAEQIVKERGLTPHLFAGDNLTVTNSGKTVTKARGFIQGKNVFVRADDPHFTADQIARHEVGHDMIRDGEIDPEEVRERLHERFTEEELDAVAEKYAELYDGTDMTPEEIWEEVICDSVADMNVFAGTEAARGAPVADVLQEIKAQTETQRKEARGPPNGQKNTAPNEGGKMSRAIEPGADWKAEQLRIIQESNPMEDSYHTGVRKLEDIKTFREAMEDPDWDYDEYNPDYNRRMARNALKSGKITVYSSYAIEKGTFVSPSRMEAESYSGNGTVHSRTVRLEDVAWIDPTQGQYTGPASRSAADRVTAGRTYSYAELTAKAPIQGSVVSYSDVAKLFHADGTVDVSWLVRHVLAQCQTVQTNAEKPTHYVSVSDLGRNVEVTSNGITHGISRKNTIEPKTGRLPNTTEENAIGAINLAETLANAVEVNQLEGRGGLDTPYSHVLVGVTGAENARGKIDYMAVRFVVEERENQDPILVEASVLSKLYGIDAKKMRAVNVQGAPRSVALAHTMPHFSYRIADLLNDVKDIFDDTFSKDVYAHFGMTRRVSDFSEGKKVTLPDGSTQRPGNLKFSRTSDSLESLRQENEELRKAFAEQQRQLRKTEKKLADTRENRDNWRNKATFRPETVAKGIIKAYEGTISEADIHDQVKELIERAARRDGVTFEEIKEMAMPIARKVVESARAAANGEEARTWEAIKKHHRENKIRISTETLAEFRDDPDFKYDFRRQYGRPLNLSGTEGTPIDVAYAEMGERFGKAYYPDSITHPADQLRRMAEVRENLQPVMENPYSINMAMATEHCANELVDTVMGEVARGYRATYAGRTEEQLYQVRKSAREAIARERQRSEEQVKALKEHWREQQRQQMERRSESEDRDRLLTIARRLQNRKLPAAKRSLIEQYIGELDTVSRKLTGRTLGDLTWLEHWYNEQKADPDFIPDAATEARIQRLYQVHVDDMSRADVLELTRVLLNIENEFRTRRDFIESKEKRDIFEAGLAVMRNIENSPGSKASGIHSAADRLIVTETLSPLRQVRRMTGYVDNDPMVIATTALADGQRAMFDYKMKATARFAAFVEDKAFTKEITGKDAREIEIRGLGKDGPVTVKITPAMRISLYLHSKNPQNLQHIAGGGIRVPDMKLYKQGKIQEAYARGTVIKLTPSEVRAIVGQMTAKERRFADAAHEYFNTTSKDAINAVSEKLKGYSIAGVEDYFPIHTDDSFTRKDFESIKFDGSIEGMGFLKERIKSSSPIYLRDLNSVLTQAIDMHAKYVGLAIPVRNFNKLWGVTAQNVTKDGDMGASSSVQSAVRQKWGESGRQYIEKMMRDLQQGGREQSVYARELSKVRSAYAGAVLTLNASVAMKQAASYPTAAAVVGWKPLMAAMKNVGKVDLDLIAAYTPLQWYRSRGFSTQELGDMAKRGKQLLPALNWVQGADLLTTRKLWKAAEIYVRDNFKTLERGSAEEIRTGKSPFYQKVAEVYNRIIEETQPNYTTMQRPQLLRSDDTLLQNLQMFKTQPFQNFNILYDALGNLAAKERAWKSSQTEESRAALREAKRNAAWAVSSQAVQLAVFAGMTFVWNIFRGKRDKYEDKDGDVKLLSLLKGIGLDMIAGLFSDVPFGGDAWEGANGLLYKVTKGKAGQKYFGMDDVTVGALNDAAEAVGNAGVALSELIAAIFDKEEEADFNKFRLKLDSVADATSKALGIPYENVLNLGKAVFRHGAKWLEGDYMGQYRYLQLTTDPGGSYKGDYYDLLWQAYRKDPEAHRELYRQMVADGWDPDKIKDAMEKRMKDEQGVKSVKDLKNRYQAP